MIRRITCISAVVLSAAMVLAGNVSAQGSKNDPRLKNASIQPARNGWTFVHLEGTPSEIGYQNGYLLAPQILDMQGTLALELTHDTHKDWNFFRDAAQNMMWPHIEKEYRDELLGIAEGVKARGVKLDVWDIVALNAGEEWSYYVAQYDKHHGIKTPSTVTAPDHCSAFVATGSYTKDGKVVMAHNAWTYYLDGERWTMIYDIVPAKGNRILMDAQPGLIHSGDDFGVNSAGIIISETTISGFSGYDENGIPEFVRARKAMQYSNSIDDFARIMKKGNNGGYANNWLVADTRRNEIASLELGLKNVTLERKKDGYFVGSNFPVNPKLASEETDFKVNDASASANARHIRWDQLMAEYKGRIDAAAAEKFMADHYDTYDKKEEAGERSLCGHVDHSPRGMEPWMPPYGIAGAAQNKVADATMAEHMSFMAAAGHACGMDFNAAEHLKLHPEFDWQKRYLHDMKASPWTRFSIQAKQ
jgi:hypothetical protein